MIKDFRESTMQDPINEKLDFAIIESTFLESKDSIMTKKGELVRGEKLLLNGYGALNGDIQTYIGKSNFSEKKF